MNFTHSEIQIKLQGFIEDELLGGRQKVNPEDELLLDGYVDSVGAMRLVSFIEALFQIKIPPQDFTIEIFGTINSLSAYLENAKQ